jgi:cell wall-associated NlpC family hydrolase
MGNKSAVVTRIILCAAPLLFALVVSCASSSRSGHAGREPSPEDASTDAGDGDERTAFENKLRKVVDSYLGVRYKTGGMSRRGFDCSGFVVTVFREASGARLPRSTRELKHVGREVSRRDARPGDLVFVKGGAFGSINHVGIYLGNGEFVHASSSKGIRYDRLDDEYYTKHFAMLRRVFR